MNVKQAKRLRKMLGFDPNAPREYEKIVVATRRIKVINEDGTITSRSEDRIMTVANDERRKYKIAKNIYKEKKRNG